MATRITAALRRPVVIDGVKHVVTGSIGITYTTGSGSVGSLTADQVVRNADAAMYRAKTLGKDRVEAF